MNRHKKLFLMALVVLPVGVFAQQRDGLRFGNFTLTPFVSVEASYDSNIRLQEKAQEDFVYRVNPGLDAKYVGTDWGVVGNAWYSYDLYQKYELLNAHRYGEKLGFYVESPKGWKFMMNEAYDYSNQNDSMLSGGDGVWRNRQQFDIDAKFAYEIGERWNVGLNALYRDTQFDSKTENDYGPLFGWTMAKLGAEMEYALTPETGLILDGSFQRYSSDGQVAGESNESDGYSIGGGFGSRFTERIKYRLIVGANVYSTESDTTISPALNATVSWKISQRWNFNVAMASYYQPSESSPGQAKNVFQPSAGIAYKLAERLDMSADIVYRYENNETLSDGNNATEYATDQYTARYRVAYWFTRYANVYASTEYTLQNSDISEGWDRYRISLGCLFRY